MAIALAGALALPCRAAEPVLTARPGVCILSSPGKTECVMAMDLLWNSNGAGHYCLYSSQQDAPLRCWQRASRGQAHVELASAENVSFWLQQPPQETHLAEIMVRIVSLSQKNPERRRRRHVWSLL